MRRYNYGQNFQAFNSSKMTWLTPLGFFEVAPGDTVTGSMVADFTSDTLARKVQNRAYSDVYLFYVPFRLLWDGWVDYIANNDNTNQPPSITQSVNFFFENAGGEPFSPFHRRAYNLIWNRYFRITNYQPEQDLDNNFALATNQRESTWHESAWPPGAIDDTSVTIDVVGETVSVDALRAGFAQDKWTKTREYYGTKYVDYLSALGVKTPWTISEDPELIGKANKDWMYREVNATVDGVAAGGGENNFVGNPAGYFQTNVKTRIKPTFCPEHGIIVAVGTCRMDLPNRSGNSHPLMAKVFADKSQFYSPEFETEKVDTVSNWLFGENNGTVQTAQQRKYEDYRKASHLYGKPTSLTSETNLYYASYDLVNGLPQDYRTIDPFFYNDLFTGNLGGAAEVHYCVNSEFRMLKKSPVRPPQRVTGVS